MERGLNKVMVIGRLDGDVELRHTAGGRPVASFTVGAPRSWTTADGVQREEIEWFDVVVWGALAEICQKRLRAGQSLYVEGRLQTRHWEDQDGRPHFRTELIAHDVLSLEEAG